MGAGAVARGIGRIALRPSEDGAPLYRSLGFVDSTAMLLRLPATES